MTGAPSRGFTPDKAEEVKPGVSGFIEARLKEDAGADEQITRILKGQAFADMRAARAAECAYRTRSDIVLGATTNAEVRVVDQLVDNLLRRERAAMMDVVIEWGRAFDIDQPAVYELRQLLLRVRGDVDRDIKDHMATGQYPEEGDFLPYRRTLPVRSWPGAAESISVARDEDDE